MLVGSVVAGVATRTIGLKCRELPGDHFRVALVTIGTREIAAMILRVIRQRRVLVIRRRPSVVVMTHIALFRGAEMVLILTRRLHTIVAGCARSEHLRVIYRHDRRKHIGRMAVFADIRCLHVRRILSRRIRAVMAANAIARNVDVIEIRRNPANGAVAIITVVAAGDMRRVLASCNSAIMTGATAANDLGMIDDNHRYKNRRAVTIFTDICRLNMRRVLAGCFRAVVAVDAIGGYLAVIERRRQPASGSMTIIAGVTTRDMRWLFANRYNAVMTCSASTNYLGVIDSHNRCKNVGCVAVLADVS